MKQTMSLALAGALLLGAAGGVHAAARDLPDAAGAQPRAAQSIGDGAEAGTASFTDSIGEEARRDVSAELRWYAPQVRGYVAGSDYHSMRLRADKLEYGGDLGITDAKGPEIRARYGKFEVDYIGFRSSADGYDLPDVITFKGKSYGGTLDTDMDLDYVTANWRHPLLEEEKREVWVRLGAKYLRESATSAGISGGKLQTEHDSATGILPFVGIGVNWKLSRQFEFSIEADGMHAGSRGHVLDLESTIVYHPSASWSITAGGRWINMYVNKSDKEAQYRAEGPFFGVSYLF